MSDRPYISFAECKQKISIAEVLEKLGLTDFQITANQISGVCPLPSHEHGPRPNPQQFKAHPKDGVWLWRCFSPECGRGGDIIELVKAITDFDNEHVRFWFADHFGERLTLAKPDKPPAVQARCAKPEPSSGNLPEPLQPLQFCLQLDQTAPYLKTRSLTDETIATYGLGLCKRGQLAGYVAIPCYNWRPADGENPVGYIGRWPDDDYKRHGKSRYKVPDGFSTGQIVYGLNEALRHGGTTYPIIVVEGAFKVFHLVQCGFPRTVSTLTGSVSDAQAAILRSLQSPIILMFDGNDGGYQGMRLGAAKLITHTFVRVLKLPEGIEPDNLNRNELQSLIR